MKKSLWWGGSDWIIIQCFHQWEQIEFPRQLPVVNISKQSVRMKSLKLSNGRITFSCSNITSVIATLRSGFFPKSSSSFRHSSFNFKSATLSLIRFIIASFLSSDPGNPGMSSVFLVGVWAASNCLRVITLIRKRFSNKNGRRYKNVRKKSMI